LTMEEALILIEKRKEYDKTKKSKKRKAKWVTIIKLKNLR
jgi:DNA topoisomerase-1